MSLTPAQLGFVRAIGSFLLLGVLTYIGDASHLNGVVSVSAASLISAAALSLEHYLEAKNAEGKALFGSVTVTA